VSRYSQLYIERRTRASDSERARRRLRAVFNRLSDEYIRPDVGDQIAEELGYDVSGRYDVKYVLDKFFEEAEIHDVLDAVTIIFKVFSEERATSDWVPAVARIFDEENLAYRVDERGIVHPFVDLEFEVSRASALEALSDPRFGEARTDFEAAYRHLRDGKRKEALRMMFPAVEVTAKVVFSGKFAVFGPSEIDRHIAPRMRARYHGNQPAIDAGNQLLAGFKNWINAAQPYRHGQEIEGAAEPPTDLVIAHFSAGATYLRWMIELCSE
jgi:hypothetical protein